MNAKILSLNIGQPDLMVWNEKSVRSSMLKASVAGPIEVKLDHVPGNSFSNPQFHGTPDSVLYAYGLTSAQKFMNLIGGANYVPGSTGETITLDSFEESDVDIGDIFEIGSVLAQATYPRIPCGKVNFRMKHPQGQQAMFDCGASGVYFRILRAGTISLSDRVRRIEKSRHPFKISELYDHISQNKKFTAEQFETALENAAFPQRFLEKYRP